MSGEKGIALAGAGRFGAFCVEAFSDLPGARVVAVMDTDRDRAAAVAPPGAAVYDEYDALLADPNVDIVHIGTPPSLHGPMARRAAEHGKHVFVEKPLATTLDAAREAVDAAGIAGVQLSIDYVLRHHRLHQLAIELARSGALGSLQQFVLENFASAEHLPADHWFWDPALSGGIHVEHGVHFFDLCLALVGQDPDEVTGAAQHRPDGRVDRVAALLRFGDGAVATFYHGFNRADATERTTIRLAFERGHVVIEGWIPTSLALEGNVSAASLDVVRATFAGEPVMVDSVTGTRTHDVRVRARSEAPDRQADYRLAIRSGMLDLLSAIDGRSALRVGPSDGLRSLDVAIRATP